MVVCGKAARPEPARASLFWARHNEVASSISSDCHDHHVPSKPARPDSTWISIFTGWRVTFRKKLYISTRKVGVNRLTVKLLILGSSGSLVTGNPSFVIFWTLNLRKSCLTLCSRKSFEKLCFRAHIRCQLLVSIQFLTVRRWWDDYGGQAEAAWGGTVWRGPWKASSAGIKESENRGACQLQNVQFSYGKSPATVWTARLVINPFSPIEDSHSIDGQ